MGSFIPRFLRHLRDVEITTPSDGDVPTYDSADEKWKNAAGGGGGGAPTTADYLVGTAQAGLSAEIVVGATPAGELGGTWGSPTVDTVHSGSSHAQAQAAAEATAAGALTAHDADTSVHGIADTSVLATDAEVAAMLAQAVILAPASSARNVIQPTAGAVIAAIVKAHAAQSVDLTQWQDSTGAVLASIGPTGKVMVSPGFDSAGLSSGTSVYYYSQVGVPVAEFSALAVYAEHASSDPVAAFSALGAAAVVAASAGAITTRIDNVSIETDHYGDSVIPLVRDIQIYPSWLDQVGSIITSHIGLNIDDLGNNHGGAGSVVNSYAIRIGAQTAATGLSYAILAEGGKSLFADGLVIALIAAPADAAYANGEGGWWWDQANSLPKWKGKTSGGVVVNATPYVIGGTDVALADGGTGASLVDPNADRIMFWDDSAGAVTWLTPGTNLTITGTTLDATAGGGGAPTDASYVTVSAEAGLSAETLYTALKLDDFAAPDDNTDLNVSTSKHGLTPKLSNTATEYLSGTGVFSVPSGSGIPSTIVDVKGDLIAASAADTVARLAVGTNGLVLTADSAEATGIKWAAAASGYTASPLAIYLPFLSTGGGANPGANSAELIAFWVPVDMTINRITLDITTSGGNIDVGIYDDDGTAGAPGTRLVSSGSTATPASGHRSITVAGTLLTPGKYYAAVVFDAGVAALRYYQPYGVGAALNVRYNKGTSFPLPASLVTPTLQSNVAVFGLFPVAA